MNDDPAVRTLARLIVREMLGDDQFWSMMRELVLSVYATTDKMSREGYVRTLIRACKDRGVELHVNRAGGLIARLKVGKKLTKDLEQAIRVYRSDLIEVLKPTRNGK